MGLAAILLDRKSTIVKKWLERIFQTYPETTKRFLAHEKDPFRNPVGHSLKEGLSSLFEGLVRSADMESMKPVLDGIVRIRAVQDLTASQSLAFIFLLKQIVRAESKAELLKYPEEFAALDGRVDEMGLLAFDLFMNCREQIYEIRANEAKRMAFLLERTHRKGTAESID
jgi:hypothetical protein